MIRQQRLSCSPSLARTISPDKTIWLYTGYRWEEIKWLPFLDQIDVLIDGRFVQAQADPQLHWRGSANQRVIDVPRTLAANSIVLHDDK